VRAVPTPRSCSDGDQCLGWCQFGPTEELPEIKSRRRYDKDLTSLPDWRITCFFTVKGLRRRGVADAALGGALAEIGRHGGGTVEGYPEETDDRTLSGSFLHTRPTRPRVPHPQLRRAEKPHPQVLTITQPSCTTCSKRRWSSGSSELGAAVPTGTPGLGEGGSDARRVVRCPIPYLGGDHLEQLAVDTPVEVGAAHQVAHVAGGIGRGPQQRTQAEGFDIGAGVIEEVPNLDWLLTVDLVCRVLVGVLGAHPRLPRLPWSTSAREQVDELMVLLCPLTRTTARRFSGR